MNRKQKKARRGKDYDQEIGAGHSAGAASSSDRPHMTRPSPQSPISEDLDMTEEGQDGDEIPGVGRDKRDPEDCGRGVGVPTRIVGSPPGAGG